MPSKYGPYTAVAPVKEFAGWTVTDVQNIAVVDFMNGRAEVVQLYSPNSDPTLGNRNAVAIATQLSTDDTAYLALVTAHATGGSVMITGTGGLAAKGFVQQAVTNLGLILTTLPTAEATALASAKSELASALSSIT